MHHYAMFTILLYKFCQLSVYPSVIPVEYVIIIMDGWIKMPLGKEVGLCPGDIVLDVGPLLPSVL